jgi:hypothetical protein
MNGIFIIPTGLGCAIGGHAGDAVCAVNLIASQCDHLIINPNAVNASDINEMAANCLYVEGSTIDRFITGEILLQKRRRNKILLVTNPPISVHTINSANAARVSLGVGVEVVELETPLVIQAKFADDGSATGDVSGVPELLAQVKQYEFDALAVQTPIDVDNEVVAYYLKHGGVNPWGGAEALASKMIAREIGDHPVAHAPREKEDSIFKNYSEVTDPRLSAEMVSVSYLHCVLKGLARAPLPRTGRVSWTPALLSIADFDFLVTPDDCFGAPHVACLERGIEVIVVRENTSVLEKPFPDRCTFVDNYLECAGLIACRRAGIGEQYVRAIL